MTPDTWTIIGTGLAIAVLLIGLIAWVRSDMKQGFRQLSDRLGAVERDVARVENEVSFMRGQLSLVLPALAQAHIPSPPDPGAD